ncbi:RNA 2'-phosphotransferase [Listeria cossartiae]
MLSKEVSYVLRHTPREYELEIDKQGWVSVAQLLYALKEFLRHEEKLLI